MKISKNRGSVTGLLRIIIPAGLLIAAVILLFPSLSRMTAADILSYTPESALLAACMLIGIYCVKSLVVVIPVIALYITAGVLFSPFWAFLVTYSGLVCELTLGYLTGRRMGAEKIGELIKKSGKASRFFMFQRGNDALICFLSRILPFPCDIMSMLFGASGMPFSRFLAFSLIGLTPLMVPFIIAGEYIADPLSAGFLVPLGISIALSVGMFCTFRIVISRKKIQGEILTHEGR